MNPPEAMAMLLFLGGGFWVLRPVATAIAKRIAGEHRPAGIGQEERDAILNELQQVRHEVAELAERMDFAERMLAKPREAEPPRLGPRGA
jgi:hypothetical protein